MGRRPYELAGPPLSYTGFDLPAFVVDILVDIQRAIREGALDVESGDLERLLGRPVTPLADVVGDMISAARTTGAH